MRKVTSWFLLFLIFLSLMPFGVFNVGADSQLELTLNGNGDLSEWDTDDYSNLLSTGGNQATSFSNIYVESTYDATDHTAQAGTINEVYVIAYFSTGGSDDGGDFRLSMRVDGSSYYSDVWVIDDGSVPGTLVGYEWSTNPDDGQPWEWSDIDSLQLGISGKYHNGIDQIRCDYLHGYVNYTADLTPTTNTPSNVEESTVTLSGTTAFDASGVTCGFWYNTSTTSSSTLGGNVTVAGTFDNSDTFTKGLTGLISGEYYYYRAWSFKTGIGFFNDSTGEQYFLTKPTEPTNPTVNTYLNQLNVSWTNATTGNVSQTTLVRYKTTGYPSSITDGTLLYNGTNTQTTLNNYDPGTTYYFGFWTHIEDSGSPLLNQYSDNSNTTSLTAPTHPINLGVDSYNDTRIVLSWTKGDDDTVIVRNTTAYPDTPYSGTEVYNGSLETYTDSGLTPSVTYYYRAWNWNGTNFSVGYTNVNQSTEPQQPQNVDSETTITGGSSMNINVSWTIGTGADRTVVRRSYTSQPTTPTSGTGIYNNTGSYHVDSGITQPAYYTVFSFNTTTGLFSDGVNVSWYVVWINAYNESSGDPLSSYGVFFTNTDGTSTYMDDTCSNPHLVNVSDIPTGDDIALQVNATGYKTRVYYFDIEVTGIFHIDVYLSPSNVSELYLLTVNDPIGNPVPDAKIKISKYINETVGYEDVSIEYTDGNGQITVYLVPEMFYKFNLSKNGFENQVANWVPSSLLFTHTFVMQYTDAEPISPHNPLEDIDFTFELSGTTLYVNYSDAILETINSQVYIYEINTSTADITRIHTDTRTGEHSFSFTVTNVNISNSYKAIIHYNHSSFGHQAITLVIHGYYTPSTAGEDFNILINGLIGSHPFGWFQFLGFMFALAVFHEMDKRDSGVFMILLGGLFLFIGLFAGNIFSVLNGVLPTLFIVVGIIMLWKQSRSVKT